MSFFLFRSLGEGPRSLLHKTAVTHTNTHAHVQSYKNQSMSFISYEFYIDNNFAFYVACVCVCLCIFCKAPESAHKCYISSLYYYYPHMYTHTCIQLLILVIPIPTRNTHTNPYEIIYPLCPADTHTANTNCNHNCTYLTPFPPTHTHQHTGSSIQTRPHTVNGSLSRSVTHRIVWKVQ